MHYKTIALELLAANPDLCERLRKERRLLSETHRLSADLRASHLELAARLSEANPTRDPRLIRSQAMELAVEDLRLRLSPNGSGEDEPEGHPDSAMEHLRRRTPTG